MYLLLIPFCWRYRCSAKLFCGNTRNASFFIASVSVENEALERASNQLPVCAELNLVTAVIMQLLSVLVEQFMHVNMPQLRLERSVASSDELLEKHAPFYFLAADVATLALRFVAQALKKSLNV